MRIDRRHRNASHQLDIVLGKTFAGRDMRRFYAIGQAGLGKGRSLIGMQRFGSDKHDAALVAVFTQGKGRARATFACSDDDDSLRFSHHDT
jgi:hypothetical protein